MPFCRFAGGGADVAACFFETGGALDMRTRNDERDKLNHSTQRTPSSCGGSSGPLHRQHHSSVVIKALKGYHYQGGKGISQRLYLVLRLIRCAATALNTTGYTDFCRVCRRLSISITLPYSDDLCLWQPWGQKSQPASECRGCMQHDDEQAKYGTR